LKRFAPATASKDFHTFLGELDEAGATQKEGDVGWLESMARSNDEERRDRAYSIQRAIDAREKISYRKRASESGAVKIWNTCGLEEDFTTEGTPGRLGCPFSNNRGTSTPRSSISRHSIGRRSKRASFHDPMKTDTMTIPSAVASAPRAPSIAVEDSVPLCPIRFLDQHSPEEVAKYFEDHQHELPRSHEICIKRFQDNEDALASLDSKYANIVTMVNDLGQKHQQMLPDPDDEGVEEVQGSVAKVTKWATAVSESGGKDVPHDVQDEREQRFDRPLKDIRVGESPSRPWGIIVPNGIQADDDMVSKKSDPTAEPLEQHIPVIESKEPARCPFSGMQKDKSVPFHGNEMQPEKPVPQSSTKAQSVDDEPIAVTEKIPSQIVFNGPVFIGYPFDQAMKMMEKLGQQGRAM
jgi:hypothetical protein